jgi:hypothetical protein
MSDQDPAFDLNALMSEDPLNLSKQDLDRIIAYQRKQRVAREAGAKTKKATGEAPAVDIKALMNKVTTPKVSLKEALKTPLKPASKGGFVRRF